MRAFLESCAETLAGLGERVLRPRIRAVGMDFFLMGVALVVLAVALTGMAVALYLLLARAFEPWLAALVLGVALSVLAGALLAVVHRRARGDGKTGPTAGRPAPDERRADDPRRDGQSVRPEDVLYEALSRTRLGPSELVLTSLVAGLLMGVNRRRAARRPAEHPPRTRRWDDVNGGLGRRAERRAEEPR